MGGLKANTENNHTAPRLSTTSRGARDKKGTQSMTSSKIMDCVLGVVLTAAMFILPSVVVIAGIIVLPLVLTATR